MNNVDLIRGGVAGAVLAVLAMAASSSAFAEGDGISGAWGHRVVTEAPNNRVIVERRARVSEGVALRVQESAGQAIAPSAPASEAAAASESAPAPQPTPATGQVVRSDVNTKRDQSSDAQVQNLR